MTNQNFGNEKFNKFDSVIDFSQSRPKQESKNDDNQNKSAVKSKLLFTIIIAIIFISVLIAAYFLFFSQNTEWTVPLEYAPPTEEEYMFK